MALYRSTIQLHCRLLGLSPADFHHTLHPFIICISFEGACHATRSFHTSPASPPVVAHIVVVIAPSPCFLTLFILGARYLGLSLFSALPPRHPTAPLFFTLTLRRFPLTFPRLILYFSALHSRILPLNPPTSGLPGLEFSAHAFAEPYY